LYLGTGYQTQRYGWLSYVGPGGYVQLRADEGVGAEHVDFRLTNANGSVVLYDGGGWWWTG
jgi:hypothetical protein